jgi:hypothetical protein
MRAGPHPARPGAIQSVDPVRAADAGPVLMGPRYGEGRRPRDGDDGLRIRAGEAAQGQGRLASSPARAVAEEEVELMRQSVSLL